MSLSTYRVSSAAELRAFDALCNTLAGFDERLHFEHVDGLLTALAATPHAPVLDEAVPLLLGDAWSRAYADPEAQAAALKTLQQRLAVLRDQLDPAALLDDPDGLRIEPLLADWEATAEAAGEAAGGAGLPTGAVAPRVGELWAQAFLEAVQALPAAWPIPAADGAAEAFESAFGQLELLTLERDGDAWAERVKATFEDHQPTEDDLIAAACAAVQDLRLFWVDFAPKPETRRVEAAPGRNDPCPCGSGKKYKKCHGA